MKLPLLVFLLLLFACQQRPITADFKASAILYGQEVHDNDWPAVVALTDKFGPFCTGSLIRSNIVLTAAHCVKGGQAKDIKISLGNGAFEFYTGQHQVKQIQIHPQYGHLQNDVAYLVLKENIYSVTPLTLIETEKNYLQHPATLIGLGETEKTKTLEIGNEKFLIPLSGKKYQATATIVHHDNSLLFLDGPNYSGPCHGDSGGPALVETDGEYKIIGILYGGSFLGCGPLSTYTHIKTFNKWFNSSPFGRQKKYLAQYYTGINSAYNLNGKYNAVHIIDDRPFLQGENYFKVYVNDIPLIVELKDLENEMKDDINLDHPAKHKVIIHRPKDFNDENIDLIFGRKKKISGQLYFSGAGFRLYDTEGLLPKDQLNIVWRP